MDIDAKKTDTPDAEADKDDKKNATAVSEKIAEGERCAYESCRDHGGERGDGHDVAKILHKDEHFARCVEGDLRGQNDGEKDGENTKDEGEARNHAVCFLIVAQLQIRGWADEGWEQHGHKRNHLPHGDCGGLESLAAHGLNRSDPHSSVA